MTTLSKEDVVRVDNDLLAMIQKHFPSLPLDDRYTDWGKWLGFAKAVYSHGEQAARADLVAENERLKEENAAFRKAWNADQLFAELRTTLAAAEAREEKLRDELEKIACLGNGNAHGNSIGNCMAIDALAQPRDDSALHEMIAGVYEECAKVCENSDRYRGDYFAAKIRELAEKAKA